MLDAAGAMVRTWGRFGREPGAFQYPHGVAVDRAGTVYVADWGNHRIQRFTREGRLLEVFGGLRFEDFDGLFNPAGVAAPDTGEILVHDRHVYVFGPGGRRLGTRPLPFPIAPHCGIAVDAAGHLYVVGDQDRRVHKLDAAGRVLASFGGGRGEGDGEFFEPMGLAVDAAGRVYVADWLRGQGRVHGFAPDGRLLGTWRRGDDGQRLRSPQGLAVDAAGAAPRGRPRPAGAGDDHAVSGPLVVLVRMVRSRAAPLEGGPSVRCSREAYSSVQRWRMGSTEGQVTRTGASVSAGRHILRPTSGQRVLLDTVTCFVILCVG